jgi:hypothetical protein
MSGEVAGLVSVVVGGEQHEGVFKVEDGIVKVICRFGERWCHLNDTLMHPELLARYLLLELIETAFPSEG